MNTINKYVMDHLLKKINPVTILTLKGIQKTDTINYIECHFYLNSMYEQEILIIYYDKMGIQVHILVTECRNK